VTAAGFFEQLQEWESISKMTPMVAMAKVLKGYQPCLLHYFEHQRANAKSEGFNSKIMSIKRSAGGYRNIENFKKAIIFYCRGLHL